MASLKKHKLLLYMVGGVAGTLCALGFLAPHYATNFLVADFQTVVNNSQQLLNTYAQHTNETQVQLFAPLFSFVGTYNLIEVVIGALAIVALFTFVNHVYKSNFICNRQKIPYTQNTRVKNSKHTMAQLEFIQIINTVRLNA